MAEIIKISELDAGTPATGAQIPYSSNEPKTYRATPGDIVDAGGARNVYTYEITDDYTLALTEAGKMIMLTGKTGKTITVPDNTSAAFPIGTTFAFTQDGTGALTIAAAAGVTIRYKAGLVLEGQYAMAAIVKTDVNTWRLTGALKA